MAKSLSPTEAFDRLYRHWRRVSKRERNKQRAAIKKKAAGDGMTPKDVETLRAIRAADVADYCDAMAEAGCTGNNTTPKRRRKAAK